MSCQIQDGKMTAIEPRYRWPVFRRFFSKLTTRECLLKDDISNGKETNKIPTWSYKRSDKAPSNFHYVTGYVQYKPVPVCYDICHDENKVQVSLIRTKNRGWGVRTEENFTKDTFIGAYAGELISADESTQREDDSYLFNLSGNNALSTYVCDAKDFGNFTRFINHSCEPNVVGIRHLTKDGFPYIAFFANQDIPKKTELTLNYGDNYWLIKSKRDGIYCLCKRANCKFRKQ